ncbi:phosphate acyltransferase PlsX [Flexilinea flocculi]|jgi:glycerol-3-phosphate acyltransferase PlsX|uniref:Phosphate acyltransferase n=1 Tax=Flexilinea flocculi TaxID=1678840 RepID=A0A0S7BU26_9CHLR|nr:phosphate acyltransferase PlsX [Flexilinea flocculi]NMB93182.1 phosphate acyltransferase PlsX [Flexilinea flocculi]GAP40265.1 phosphate:acyl-[acyl carrier protein] acyltransferase [Flexilinea flocculi]
MAIVLDAMGSDDFPKPEIEAAIQFSTQTREKIFLVGHRDIIYQHVSENDLSGLPIEVIHAEDILEMGEKAVKSAQLKPNNSMAVGLQLVKEGAAGGFITAGNTGAAMFNSLRKLGRIQNVARPALTTLFPTRSGFCVVLDIGANSDCRPEYLQQFAMMGSIYAEKMQKISAPRVGLLNNGEEAGKGNELARNTYTLLESSGLNFIGNVEAKDVFAGKADVVVTDGFTGNVFLKTSEAAAKMMSDLLKESLLSSLKTKIGALLAKDAFKILKVKMDPNAIGAAPLLGIDGLSFVGHGRSNSTALFNGMKLVKEAMDIQLVSILRETIQEKLS